VAGLILIGGADSIFKGVFLKKIIPDSPAHKDGRLQPGDRILRINNTSMEHASHNTALQALQNSPSLLPLTVYRDPAHGQAVLQEDGVCMCVVCMCACKCEFVYVYM